MPDTWLNDAVKAYLSPRGEFDSFLELAHLKVFVPRPEYLLAMKCAAMRLGEEFHDLDDVRYLLRHLNITTAEGALAIVTRYFDEGQLLPKTRLVVDEGFADAGPQAVVAELDDTDGQGLAPWLDGVGRRSSENLIRRPAPPPVTPGRPTGSPRNTAPAGSRS